MDLEPFKDIYIHGLVRDKKGRKMSKSLGNGIDPLEVIEEYGADAFKFTLTFLAAQGQDILIDKDSFKIGSKFANKIWNAARYILMNSENRKLIPLEDLELKEVDLWIYHKLNETVTTVHESFKNYRFNDAAQAVYEFFWNDYCDWYIEVSKLSLYCDDDDEKNRAISLLISVLEESLRLLHPFLSFITEEIYQKLPQTKGSIVIAKYPEINDKRNNIEIGTRFSRVQDLIRSIRTLRSEFTISPDKKIKVTVKAENEDANSLFTMYKDAISMLVGSDDLQISNDKPETKGTIPIAGSDFEAFLFVKEVVDLPKEIAKLEKEKNKLEKECERTNGKLSNESFIKKAPENVVTQEKNKLEDFKIKIKKITSYLNELTE